MNRLTLTSLLISLSFSMLAQQKITGLSWQDVKKNGKGTLKVLHFEHPPYVQMNPGTGKLEGACQEILDEFINYVKATKGIDLTLEYVGDADFVRMMETVGKSTGGVIGIGDIGVNEERKKQVAFTDPFVKGGLHLITSYQVPTLVSVDDIPEAFKGFKAYSIEQQLGDRFIWEIQEKYLPDLEVIYVTMEELPNKIAADPKSFSYIGISIFAGTKARIKSHRTAYKPARAGFIFPKESEWANVYNEFMRANGGFLKSDAYKQIIVNHLGESIYKISTSDKY